MVQRLLRRHAAVRVELQHLVKHVALLWRGGREHGVPVPALQTREAGLDEITRRLVGGRDERELLIGRRPQDVADRTNLVEEVLPSEHRGAPDQLPEDAAHAPKVYGSSVLHGGQDDLRCAVPACADVLRAQEVVVLRREARPPPGQAEVAELDVTVLVHQHVERLQVSMHHVRGVDVEQGPKYVVGEELDVVVAQRLFGADHGVQVCVHELRDEVDLVEIRG
mmetsp:Transcript_89002/g.265511  ORF Transcript_89002/g.265511 Transcript_89002/m.265511 type:complete len:223 (+) Transcript_89002:204-872(+)